MKKIFMGLFIFFMVISTSIYVNGDTKESKENIFLQQEDVLEIVKVGKDLDIAPFWCAFVGDNLLIYTNRDVLKGVGLMDESEKIDEFVNRTKNLFNIESVNVFVHRKGYYIKDSLPTGLK